MGSNSENGGAPLRRRSTGVALIAALTAVASPAVAASPILDIRIPPQSRTRAVLALGEAAQVSIGFRSDARCAGEGSAVGRMTLARAFQRLLGGSNCRAVLIGDRTYVIVAISPSALSEKPSIAPNKPANTSEPEASTEVGELVVTVGKRPELLSETSYSLTALPQATLRIAGAADASALPALAAGVTVTNLGPGRDKILLRGLSDGPLTGHTQSTVGIYLDDLRLTYNAPDPDLRWTDVKQVELLKGPQGSLYGAGSIGGVLRVVTNAPDPTRTSGALTATLEDGLHGAASSIVEGFLNQPIGDRAAVRIVGWTENDGGYIDNLATGAKNANRTHRDGFRAALLWRPAADLALRATVIDQSINTRDAQYAEPAIGPLARSAPTAEPHDNDFRALNLSADWEPGWADVTATLGLIDHNVISIYDASLAPTRLTAGLERPSYVDDNHIQGLVSETRIASRSDGNFRWLFGAFGALGDQKIKQVFRGTGGTIGYAEARRDQLLEGALFGEASLELTSRLTFTVGGRLFFSHAHTHADIEGGSEQPDFAAATHDTGFAPKVLAAYRVRSGLSLYAQAANGYRASGFNTGGGGDQTFAISGSQPLRRYLDDSVWSYESGLRVTALGGALHGRAAAFYAIWRDIQSDLLLPNGLPFTANIGDGRIVGLEGEIGWSRGRLSVSGNGVIEDPELDRPDPGFPTRADSTLPGVPGYAFAIRSDYLIPLRGSSRLRLAGQVGFVGPSHLTFDSITAPSMGEYVESRLSAELELAGCSVAAYVTNLGDGRGDTFAYGNPFTVRSTRQTTPQRPTTFGVSLTRGF